MALPKDDNKKKKRSVSFDMGNMMFGKVPPQAKELEEAVLGAIMLEKSAYDEVASVLKPHIFYVDAHQRIFKAMQALAKKNMPIDLLTVVEELKTTEELDMVGGPYYVTRLTNAVVSSANIVAHSRIVMQKWIQREMIRISGEIIGDAYEDSVDIFELLQQAEERVKEVNFEIDETRTTSVANVAKNVIERFEKRAYYGQKNEPNPNDVFTGIPEWDRINGPMFPGLYVICGRPGMGKGVHMTELLCRMGKNHPVGCINGEMTNEQLLVRIGCNLLNLDNFLWKKPPNQITEEDKKNVYLAMQEAINLKLFIDDGRYIDRIANRIKRWVERDGVKAVLADFLTIFKVPESVERYLTDTQKVNYIIDVFTNLAKKLKIPIILYVQMNRENLKRTGSHEPTLSDLKQSGAIEEYAFQVSGLHRPEYYDPDAITDEFGESTKGLMYQIILKHRDGLLGKIKYKALLNSSKLEDWDENLVPGWKPPMGNWKPVVDFTEPKTGVPEEDAPF